MVEIKCSLSNEKELAQCIKYHPESVEEGLKIIDTFFRLSNGREIDVLAIDKDNKLVIMELKTGIDNNQLVQVMDYYDWVLNNFDTLKRIYPNTNFENVAPRLILVAEDYSDEVLTLSKYLKDSIEITLYRYIAIKYNNEKVIICNEKNIPDAPEIFNPTTERDLFNYIEADLVKINTKKLIEDIRSLDQKVTAEVKNWWGFSIKYNGRVFGTIAIRRKYINCSIKADIFSDQSWTNFENISSDKDFKEKSDDFKEAFNNAKNKLEHG